jgi:glycosyltransferase involved in cell wall biosynthesis
VSTQLVRVLRLTPSDTFVSAASFEESFRRHQASAFATTSADSRDWAGYVLASGLSADEQAARFAAATDDVDFLFPGYDLMTALPLLAELRNRARSRARLLVRAHSPALCPLEWALLCPLIMPGDVIMCPSTSARALLASLAPALEASLVVSPAPVGPLPRRPPRGTSAQHPVRLVTLGRVMPAKLLHRVIDGVASLRPGLRSRTQLRIGGPLTGQDGRTLPYAASLDARAARLGLSGAVRLAGLVQGDQAKARFLGGADVLVNLSVSPEESFGMVVAEALSAGTPVVVTRWDGLPELAGPAGAVVPVGLSGPLAVCDVAPADVAAAIEAAAADPALRAACLAQAATYEPGRTAAALAVALREALAARDAAPAPGPVREDLADHQAASGAGLLGCTIPLPELGWSEVFELSSAPGPQGDGLRRQLVEALLPPVTRLMAGLPPPEGDAGPDGHQATATSELVALWHDAVAGTAHGPVARLDALRRLPGRAAAVRFVEVERARAAGELTAAADLACQGIDELLAAAGAEHAGRALHQLVSVCRAAGRVDEAIARLRRWLALFPDEPATPAICLLLAGLAAGAASGPGSRESRRLLDVACAALAQASAFLGEDDPALTPIAGRVLALNTGGGAVPGPAREPGRCTA